MKKLSILLIVLGAMLSLTSCDEEAACCLSQGPRIVFKLKDDSFYDKITIDMKDNEITSYPSPGNVQKPTRLNDGYLTSDIRNTYLTMTIDEYNQLDEAFNAEILLKYVVKESPIEEIYNCCNQCKFTDEELNELIDNSSLGECEKM